MSPHFLYIVGPNDQGPVKIGRGSDAYGRVNELQIGNWVELHVLAAIETASRHDAVLLEGCVHAALGHAFVRGEWFAVSLAYAVQAVRDVAERLGVKWKAVAGNWSDTRVPKRDIIYLGITKRKFSRPYNKKRGLHVSS